MLAHAFTQGSRKKPHKICLFLLLESGIKKIRNNVACDFQESLLKPDKEIIRGYPNL